MNHREAASTRGLPAVRGGPRTLQFQRRCRLPWPLQCHRSRRRRRQIEQLEAAMDGIINHRPSGALPAVILSKLERISCRMQFPSPRSSPARGEEVGKTAGVSQWFRIPPPWMGESQGGGVFNGIVPAKLERIGCRMQFPSPRSSPARGEEVGKTAGVSQWFRIPPPWMGESQGGGVFNGIVPAKLERIGCRMQFPSPRSSPARGEEVGKTAGVSQRFRILSPPNTVSGISRDAVILTL